MTQASAFTYDEVWTTVQIHFSLRRLRRSDQVIICLALALKFVSPAYWSPGNDPHSVLKKED
jgi:hypothetical protein